jgi:hypothetical protein
MRQQHLQVIKIFHPLELKAVVLPAQEHQLFPDQLFLYQV